MAGSHRQKPTLYNPRTYTFCFGGLHKHILRHIAQTHMGPHIWLGYMDIFLHHITKAHIYPELCLAYMDTFYTI